MNGSLAQRLESLSPSKRVLLEMKVRGKSARMQDPLLISRRKNATLAPLSLNQESLLFMEQLNPDTPRYNIYEAVRLAGDLDFAALHATLETIVARHETLRTVFREIAGQPHQVFAPPRPVTIQIIDLTDLAAEQLEKKALDTLNKEANRPMDLQKGPLFRAALIRLARQDNILLVTMHHIISDGWSIGLFWKEFKHLYRNLSEGQTPELPKLPIQFGDYTFWSREQLQKDLARQTGYWKHQLAGAPTLLEMPTDRPRPAIQSFKGAQELEIFPAELCHALKNLSQREGATFYMTLLGAFDALLARYTGQEDLVVGSPIAGRNKTETENLIGFFVNTLAMRADLSGDPTFRELLCRVRNTTLDAFSHQEIPFEKVVAAASPQRSLSYNPIYQVAFALQEASESLSTIPGLKLTPIKLPSTTSKFDLFLSARETSAGLAITAEYSTDLFEAETIKRFIGHYRNVLEAVVESPDLRVSELPLMSDAERHQVLVEWNDTKTDYPNESINQLFELQAAKDPESIAVVSREGDLTYRTLNEQANQIGHYLRKLGVVANKPVGIFMERSPLMTTGILGILKSGGAYLPLDPGYPESRLRHMLDDADISVILTTTELSARIPETFARVICLDGSDDIKDESIENPPNVNTASDLAYVIYTSGSTGTPKGTLIPHRAVNRLVFNTNYIEFDSNDRLGHISNVSFDAATFELWGALLHGGRLVVLDKDLVLSPKDFVAELRAQQVTAMFLTTALFNLISHEDPSAFKTLKTLLVGGDACDPSAIRRVLENDPPRRLLNGYGPTESTTFAITKHFQNVPPGAHSVPLGRPLANTTIYLLDQQFNPVPVGVPGEIFIGGDGLAIGYLNRPELTAEKFVNVPACKIGVSTDPAGNDEVRLYRTGDIGRYLANGDIDFLGRKDNQVKLRGFRIELGEIEAVLNAHPGVKEAVVLLNVQDGDKRLAAYFTNAEGYSPMSGELREFLKNKLPEYMVPSIFVTLAELDLNENGKIDRHKLRLLEAPAADTEKETAEAHDELELKLTWIWQKVLGVRSIGVRDNFFELGGHSLAAVRVFSEIENTLDCRLPLATLFKAPTIEQLAALVRDGGWEKKWGALVPLRPAGNKPPFFCVHAVGGNVLEYNDLANHLGNDQPFYGLQALGLDGRSAPLTDIESMATAYLNEIRQIQPHGPYFLGGRSFGGTVAYEMARLLVEQGEEVALLAIFDSYPNGWLKLCSDEEAARYRKEFRALRIKRHLENWKGLGIKGKAEYFLNKAKYKSRKYENQAWRLTQKLGVGGSQSVATTIRGIEEHNYMAVRNYVPKLYPGTVTFFCAVEEICPEENLIGWRRLARGGVDVVDVPGDHQTMIKEPNVELLAQALEDSINQRTKA